MYDADAYHLISTPENVDLRLELAGVGNRVLACFIDTLISYVLIISLWLILLLFFLIASRTAERFHFSLEYNVAVAISVGIIALALLATLIIAYGYFIFFEGLWQGQTPGKKFAGIRVVRENGEPITWPIALLRNILRILDEGVFLVGMIFMVILKDEKRLGDLAAGTIVIRERKPTQLQIQNKAGTTNIIKDDFANSSSASALNEEDYDLLSSFLRRRRYMLKPQRTQLAKQLADYFSMKLNNQPNTATNSEVYLERLL